MSLSTAEKTALVTSVQELSTQVNALVVDPDVNPLQATLDVALAQIATLQAKIDAAKLALA